MGFLCTSRGRGRGLRLAKAPEEITVSAVVRALAPLKFVGRQKKSWVDSGTGSLASE